MRDSVTVSMAAERTGMLRRIPSVSFVWRSTSWGWIEDAPGTREHIVEGQTFADDLVGRLHGDTSGGRKPDGRKELGDDTGPRHREERGR